MFGRGGWPITFGALATTGIFGLEMSVEGAKLGFDELLVDVLGLLIMSDDKIKVLSTCIFQEVVLKFS